MNRQAGYLVKEVVEVMSRYWWLTEKEPEPQDLIELEKMV